MNVYILMGPEMDGYTIVDIFEYEEDAEAERLRLLSAYAQNGIHLEVQEWPVNNGKT